MAIDRLVGFQRPPFDDRRSVICVTIKQSYKPRLYDCLMVTQMITLNPELHGVDSCQGHSYGKVLK